MIPRVPLPPSLPGKGESASEKLAGESLPPGINISLKVTVRLCSLGADSRDESGRLPTSTLRFLTADQEKEHLPPFFAGEQWQSDSSPMRAR